MPKKPKPKRPAPRFRNANPTAPRSTTPRVPRIVEPLPETPGWHLLHTAGGALGASLAGALAARYGFHPNTIATVITGIGGGIAWKGTTQRARSIAAGAASAGGSQLMLQALKPNEPKPEPANQNQVATVTVRPKNAGALPPGSLDAAFERARAELALTHDAYEATGFAA